MATVTYTATSYLTDLGSLVQVLSESVELASDTVDSENCPLDDFQRGFIGGTLNSLEFGLADLKDFLTESLKTEIEADTAVKLAAVNSGEAFGAENRSSCPDRETCFAVGDTSELDEEELEDPEV